MLIIDVTCRRRQWLNPVLNHFDKVSREVSNGCARPECLRDNPHKPGVLGETPKFPAAIRDRYFVGFIITDDGSFRVYILLVKVFVMHSRLLQQKQ